MEILSHAKNHRFTYHYSQPEDYRFCQDSVIFAKFVAERVHLDENSHVLDLCSGCGVLGFELGFYHPRLKKVDFLEIQPLFKEHFLTNLKKCEREQDHFRFLEMNYRDLEPTEIYDLIICNPPYFFPREGRLSPSELRNRCRFFIDASFEDLISAIARSLKPEGQAYLLVKSGDCHGRNSIEWLQKLNLKPLHARSVAEIRGTYVVQLLKEGPEQRLS